MASVHQPAHSQRNHTGYYLPLEETMFVRMRTYFNKQESGQVLIQVAVMLVVLLGFVALAVDVGNVYSERRRMQNAADAGALAGARELCFVNSTDLAKAKEKAVNYMEDNGAATAMSVATIKEDSSNIIETTAGKKANTFFAAFAGFPTLDVKAEASAACGAANSACGLWPVAFDLGLWEDELQCGDEFVIWDGDNEQGKEEQENLCVIDGEPRSLCDCYECDLDNSGEDDFRVLTNISRGYLDYSGVIEQPYEDICDAGCSASELFCRFNSDSAAKISAGACIPGLTGTKWKIKSAVDNRADDGDPISVPLFDSTGCSATGKCAKPSADTYHIAKFGCITVEGWLNNNDFALDPKPEYKALHKDAKTIRSKVILVSVNCDGTCVTSCGGTDGTVPKPWEVKAVSLIE
jgi:Flp pilus assembly protein TadG